MLVRLNSHGSSLANYLYTHTHTHTHMITIECQPAPACVKTGRLREINVILCLNKQSLTPEEQDLTGHGE